MLALLAACPLAGGLPNTGAGGWGGFIVGAGLLLVALAGVVAVHRRSHSVRVSAATAILLLAGATGGSTPAAAACSTGGATPAAQVYAASVFKAAGGEPNVSISPSGKMVMIDGLGSTSPASLYRSSDYGAHFTAINPTFSSSGGGDWDMRWIDDTHIIAADLSIQSGIYIHRSSDAGDHWTTTSVHTDTYDRPWIDHFGPDKVYLVTKGFDGIPYLYQSTDGGATFGTPPIPLLLYGLPNQGGPDVASSFITNQNAYIDHLWVNPRDGGVYVLYGIDPGSTYAPQQPEGAPNQLYVAHLENGAMVSHPVQVGATDESCLGGFNWLTGDTAGTLYALGNCRIAGRWSTWLSYSRDGAHNWSPLVDLGEAGASNVYGSIAGADPGKLSLIYLRGSNTDPSTAQDWFAQMGTVTGADTAAPTVARVRPISAAMHTQDICFDGILCGTVPPFGVDRNLLDYIWNAVGPDGTAYGIFCSDGPATGSATGKTPTSCSSGRWAVPRSVGASRVSDTPVTRVKPGHDDIATTDTENCHPDGPFCWNGTMGFVVIRRFRDGEGPASSRVYGDQRHAREMARTWAREGWEVELIESGRRESTTLKLPPPRHMPPKRVDA